MLCGHPRWRHEPSAGRSFAASLFQRRIDPAAAKFKAVDTVHEGHPQEQLLLFCLRASPPPLPTSSGPAWRMRSSWTPAATSIWAVRAYATSWASSTLTVNSIKPVTPASCNGRTQYHLSVRHPPGCLRDCLELLLGAALTIDAVTAAASRCVHPQDGVTTIDIVCGPAYRGRGGSAAKTIADFVGRRRRWPPSLRPRFRLPLAK